MPTRDRVTSPGGILFRDLNGNGVMEPYENRTSPADERAADLLTRMTLEEKAGLTMVSMLQTGEHGDIVEGEELFRDATSTIIHDKRMNHFNVPTGASSPTSSRPEFTAAGRDTQRRSLTLLKNEGPRGLPLLPLAPGTRVYAPDLTEEELRKHAIPVLDPAKADVTILRLRAPYEARNNYFLKARFHAGRLDFDASTLARVADLSEVTPVILDVYLDRPAILGPLADDAAAIIANYGCAEDSLLNVLFGAAAPQGRLPFELPRSMAAVGASLPDLPADTSDPLDPYGFGLSYEHQVL
jgi:hypothetical protein